MTTRLLFQCCAAVALIVFPAALTNCSRDPAVREARHLKRGKDLMEKRDYSHALLEFTNAAKLMPKDAEAHYLLGLALLESNRAPQAVSSLQTAVRLDPKHAAAQIKLGADGREPA